MDDLFGTSQDHRSRGLKGGRGGGGGGGGGGRGGRGGGSTGRGGGGGSRSYGGSRGNSPGGGGSGNTPLWVLWVLIAIPVFVVLILLLRCTISCCLNKKKRAPESESESATGEFDQAVSTAREKYMTTDAHIKSSADATRSNFEAYEADFDVKYKDPRSNLSTLATIRLENNGNGYKIEGDCSDADGGASVTDGFISFTGDGWWVEETFSGTNTGVKVLNEGKFDFVTDTFTGTWRANINGKSGYHTDISGKNVFKTVNGKRESNVSTPDTMFGVNHPTAVVQPEPEFESARVPFVSNPPTLLADYHPSNQSDGADLYVPLIQPL